MVWNLGAKSGYKTTFYPQEEYSRRRRRRGNLEK
ncbi:MAG: hypothetical protein ACI9XO_005035, partial [Paraglaciecola sp.]